jgi:hypothetical protein
MTEDVSIARLWSGFHHLSEDDKNLVLAIVEAARQPGQSREDGRTPESSPDSSMGFFGDSHEK